MDLLSCYKQISMSFTQISLPLSQLNLQSATDLSSLQTDMNSEHTQQLHSQNYQTYSHLINSIDSSILLEGSSQYISFKKDQQGLQISYITPLQNMEQQIFIKIQLNFTLNKVSLESFVVKNGIICKVVGMHLRKILAKQFLQLNANLSVGSAFICYFTGQFSYRFQSYFNYNSIQNFREQINISQRIHELKIFWAKIIINIRNMHLAQDVKTKSQIEAISELVLVSHNEKILCTIKKLQISQFKQQLNKQQQSTIKEFAKSLRPLHQKSFSRKFSFIIKQFQSDKKSDLQNTKQIQKCKYQSLIRVICQHNEYKQKNNDLERSIYQTIDIKKILKKQLIYRTYKSDINLYRIQQKLHNKNIIPRYIVGKLSTNPNQRNNQINILSAIKNEVFPFIAHFYATEFQELKNQVLSQFSSTQTLNRYLQTFQIFISSNTKLFLLYMICLSLIFLKDHKITHLDVKQANILVHLLVKKNQCENFKTLILKLIDFGNSYISSQSYKTKQEEFKRGYTIPYSAHNLILQDKFTRFNEKFDVFSFGVMGLEIMFNQYSVDLRRIGKKAFKNYSYCNFFTMCPEKTEYYGEKILMNSLYYLFLKCISIQEYKRPTLDWILIILKESLRIENKLSL